MADQSPASNERLIAEARAYANSSPWEQEMPAIRAHDLVRRLADALAQAVPEGNAEPPPNPSARSLPPQLLELSRKATPGPWEVRDGRMVYSYVGERGRWYRKSDVHNFDMRVCRVDDMSKHETIGSGERNAAFIVAAANYIRSCESAEAAGEAGGGAALQNPPPVLSDAGEGKR